MSVVLVLAAILITLCSGFTKGRHRNNALIKREKTGNNHYNSAKKIFDYDQLLEEQEENDLFFNDYNDEEEEYQVPKKRYREKQRRKRRNEYSSQIMGGDGADDDDDEDEEEEESGEDQYSDKEQLTAFLLSFFLGGVGAGRFYVGDYAVASIKLLLPIIVCIIVCIVGCVATGIGVETVNDSESMGGFAGLFERLSGGAGIGAAISSCGCCAWQIWWLVDWILFAMNEIPDADGKTLYPM